MAENNVAVEEMVNQICENGVQEAAKGGFDLMQAGVTGAAIFGVVSGVSLIGYGFKKLVYDRFIKKAPAEEGFEDDPEAADGDETKSDDYKEVEETKDEPEKENKKKGK